MKLEAFRELTAPSRAGKMYKSFLSLIERMYIPIFIILSLIILYLCFYRLDYKYVDSFDEARHGVNAYEMLENSNPLVNTYNYEADYWNLKPPLSYWCIMLSFMIFGTNVFALRFYSALCYFITCVVCGIFTKRYSKLTSLFTMGFLAASQLAFVAHMARSGDADALYTMLFTFAMLAMMTIAENKKMLYICGLCFGLAFLTKSWHSGMIVIIGGLYLIFTKEIQKIKPKEWILFILSFSLPVLIWASARFIADGPEFFIHMLTQDLLNRTGSAIEGHEYPFTFYYDYIFKGDYIYRTAMTMCLIGAIFFNTIFQKGNIKKFIGYLLWFFIPFIGFSLVKTKLIWYVYPSLIPLAVIAAIFCARLLETEQILVKIKTIMFAVLLFLIVSFTQDNIVLVSSGLSGDDFQAFISQSVDRDKEFDNANAYIFLYSDEAPISYWTQANLFVSEISGNLRCRENGMDGFIEDSSKSVLFISTDYYELFKDKELKGFKVINENENYTLIGK